MDIFGRNDTLMFIDYNGIPGAVFNGSMWVILFDCPVVYTLVTLLMSFWNNYLDSSHFELPFNLTAGYPMNISPIVSVTNILNMSSVIQQDGNYSYTDGNNTDNDGFSGNVCMVPEDAVVSIIVISSCFAIVMLISHVIITLLGYLDKEILSPIFITLQSFSIVSIIDGFNCWWDLAFTCSENKINSTISCGVWLGITKFAESSIYYHLLLLSSLRIYMTLYPLQCQANVTKTRTRYILCCMYLFNVVATPIYVYLMYTYDKTCTLITYWANSTYLTLTISEELLLLCLSFIVILVFIIGMLISFVKSRLSSARLQSSVQRQQSRLASTIIILFFGIYWPSKVFQYWIVPRCDNAIAMTYIRTITISIKLLFHTVNPFILCLRLKSIRQKLKAASCQKCTGQ